jgi:hypothetical protein
MNESVTSGMTRALDSSNKARCAREHGAILLKHDVFAGICDARKDGLEERGVCCLLMLCFVSVH